MKFYVKSVDDAQQSLFSAVGSVIMGELPLILCVCVLSLLRTQCIDGLSSESWFSSVEMRALQTLHDSTGGNTTWAWREGTESGIRWNFSQTDSGDYVHSPCSDDGGLVWQGISCSNSSSNCATQVCHVTTLDLSSFGLHGTLSNSLGDLAHLTRIGLWNNELHGSIPSSLGGLRDLEVLDLYGNMMSGGIPETFSGLTAMRQLFLGDNVLTGPLIPELGAMTLLTDMYFNINQLTGPLPPALGALLQLDYLSLNNNMLTGPLIPEVGNLVLLETLSLYNNQLTGSLPDLHLLVHLKTLYLSNNSHTGPLPPELGSMVSLQYFLLYDNAFTGTVPTEYGNMTSLLYFSVYDNLLSGGLLPQMASWTSLLYLSVINNHFTGPIISEVFTLHRLEYVSLARNMFTGPLLPELGELVKVDHLTMHFNRLSGPIPSEVGSLVLLEELRLDHNHFSKGLPQELGRCSALRLLRAQGNSLTGSLEGLFSAGVLPALENLDLSDNRLSGSVPRGSFQLPSMEVIALSLNCFEGALPTDMCSARNVSVLSMDGLGAASGCKNAFTVPLSKVTLFNTLEGTIPSCLFSLPRLQVLHLAGNGLTGSISNTASISPLLQVVSLSHNKITGTIPQSLQSRRFDSLDLSFNKLTGRYYGLSSGRRSNSPLPTNLTANDVNVTIFLEVNRLSGRFPSFSSKVTMEELSAVRGNLFGCGNIPSEDEYSEDYTCGSEALDWSLYLSLAVLASLALLMLSLLLLRDCRERHIFYHPRLAGFRELVSCLTVYTSYLGQTWPASTVVSPLQKIYTFGKELRVTTKLFGVLLGVHLVTCVPIYFLKIQEIGVDNSRYMTHSHQYRWILSLTYLRGTVPLILLLCMWATAVCALRLLTARDGPFRHWFPWISGEKPGKGGRLSSGAVTKTESTMEQSSSSEEMEEGERTEHSKSKYVMIMLLNCSVVGTANGIFIHVSSKSLPASALVGTQIAMALFKFGWSLFCVPFLGRRMQAVEKIVRVELLLRIVNDIILPCVVAAMTSPVCFQGFLVSPDEVTSSYSYNFCFQHVTATGECVVLGTEDVTVAPLVPPFSYNNLCSSVVLSSFVPVFMFLYAIQVLLPLLYLLLFTGMKYPAFLPEAVLKSVNGVFWPDYWQRTTPLRAAHSDRDEASGVLGSDPLRLLKANRIISADILNHLLLLFTFGMCSPFLALSIVLAATLKQRMWILLLGRFVHARTVAAAPNLVIDGVAGNKSSLKDIEAEEGNISDPALLLLASACVPVREKVTHCVWPIIWTSALFFSFLSWDILGDAVGWKQAVWAPVLTLSVPAGLWVFSAVRGHVVGEDEVEVEELRGQQGANQGMIAMQRMGPSVADPTSSGHEGSFNPLHE